MHLSKHRFIAPSARRALLLRMEVLRQRPSLKPDAVIQAGKWMADSVTKNVRMRTHDTEASALCAGRTALQAAETGAWSARRKTYLRAAKMGWSIFGSTVARTRMEEESE